MTLREDKLLSGLQEVCALVFADVDAMVESAMTEAKAAAQVNRTEADRLRGELAQVDREASTGILPARRSRRPCRTDGKEGNRS